MPSSSSPTSSPPASAPAGAATAHRSPAEVLHHLERLALPVLLVIVVVFFSLFPPTRDLFLTTDNISVVLANQSVVLLVAGALLFPLICGHFDFSVGATAVFANIVCAAAMSDFGWAAWQACGLALGAGALVGLANGVVVARFRMNSFVSTLGMATALNGIIQWYTGGLAIIGIDRRMTTFGSTTWLGLPLVVFVVLVVLLLAWYVLTHTPYGRSLYALGSNARSAVLVGLPQRGYTRTAFMLSGAVAAVAGTVLTARTGGANPDSGTSLLFPALTAAFLGTTGFQPGRFNVPGTIVGVLFVAASVSGLTLSGADTWVTAGGISPSTPAVDRDLGA
ncbi:ABC transporter permease [Actinomadura fibrosa]|uniref:ABC transporter permease n=1 Tax=Actinomadura fibrosa TaxID=111802 RepID=A0ABW2Y1D3_9ACTN|nr:ABC transporter permease [Actinomadura fibrosa]